MTPSLHGVLDIFLVRAAMSDPNVAVYEWMNSSVGGHACKGSDVNAPVGSHHILPPRIPCYINDLVVEERKTIGTNRFQDLIHWRHNLGP